MGYECPDCFCKLRKISAHTYECPECDEWFEEIGGQLYSDVEDYEYDKMYSESEIIADI